MSTSEVAVPKTQDEEVKLVEENKSVEKNEASVESKLEESTAVEHQQDTEKSNPAVVTVIEDIVPVAEVSFSSEDEKVEVAGSDSSFSDDDEGDAASVANRSIRVTRALNKQVEPTEKKSDSGDDESDDEEFDAKAAGEEEDDDDSDEGEDEDEGEEEDSSNKSDAAEANKSAEDHSVVATSNEQPAEEQKEDEPAKPTEAELENGPTQPLEEDAPQPEADHKRVNEDQSGQSPKRVKSSSEE